MALTADLEPEADRSIAFERMLNAPRELVFEVFSSARHLGRWWGPSGFSTTTSAFDFRPGGAWRFVMHGPDGRDYPNRLVFEAIERPSRIVARHDSDGADEASHELRISFEAVGANTRLRWLMVFPSIAERDRVVREYGAEQGLRETIGRLAALVEGGGL